MDIDELASHHSENALLCLSDEYIILKMNELTENLFKITANKALHRNFFTVCQEKNIQLPFDAKSLKRQSKAPKFLSGKLTLRTGTDLLIEWKAVHFRIKTRSKSCYLLLIRIILAKNKSNNLLYLKDILENLPEYIYWKDLHFAYQGCNKRVASYLGLSDPDQIVGKTDHDFDWSPARIRKLHKNDKKVVEKKINVAFEDRIPIPDSKSHRIMLTSKSPLFNHKGNLIGILGVSTDITELKKTRRKLATTKSKLDAMTFLSSTMAHELRTPFASLELGAAGIEETLPDLIYAYQTAKEHNLSIPEIENLKLTLLNDLVSDMRSEIRSAFTFIDMLLVKLSPDHSAKSEEVFAISQCLQQVLEKYPFENNEKKLVNVSLSEDFDIQGSIVLISHVFFNLFKNALYYISASGKGQIYITTEKGKKFNKVYFKDTGAGIPATILPKIFDQFFSQTYHGTGIGLAFCKKVMESLKGHISCSSLENEYTLFTLSFPKIPNPAMKNKS